MVNDECITKQTQDGICEEQAGSEGIASSARAPALWHWRELRRPPWRGCFRLGGIWARDRFDLTQWRRVVEKEEHEDVGGHHQQEHQRSSAATSRTSSGPDQGHKAYAQSKLNE